MALTQLPNSVTAWCSSLGVAPWVVILMMVAFYIVLGCFLDAISMILITVPVFLQLATGLGYDGIRFGILVLVAVEVGMITPPVGLNIFVIRGHMPDIAFADVYRGVVPFLAAHFALIALLMLVPALALWLPGVLYYGLARRASASRLCRHVVGNLHELAVLLGQQLQQPMRSASSIGDCSKARNRAMLLRMAASTTN